MTNNDNRYTITPERVIDMLIEDRELARKEGKISASISVAKLFGDAIGMFKQQPETPTTVNNFVRTFTKQDKELFESMGINFSEIEVDPRR